MSLRAFGALVLRGAQNIAERVLVIFGRQKILFNPKLAQKSAEIILRPALKQSRRPNSVFSRLVWRLMQRSSVTGMRASTIGLWQQHGQLTGSFGSHSLARRRLILQQSHLVELSALQLIKRMNFFARKSDLDLEEDDFNWPTSLSGYELGRNMAVGCNGAVYEARLAEALSTNDPLPNLVQNEEDSVEYPLAIKMLFNYNYLAPPAQIWRDNEQELVPLVNGTFANYTLVRLYPAALPPAYELALPNCQPMQTMFLVFKRYQLTLTAYVNQFVMEQRTAQILLAQLLQSIHYLGQHRVAHRDLKSDNILLEIDEPDNAPFLVLTDFGSCLASRTRSMFVDYRDEFTDLGGNLALRAPEIRRQRAGPSTKLDYSLSDLWAVGSIAYEIFDANNPFYSDLSSETYTNEMLPVLENAPSVIQHMVMEVLRVDPAERPSPSVAATSSVLSLVDKDLIDQLLFTPNSTKNCAHENGNSAQQKSKTNNLSEYVERVICIFAVQCVIMSKSMGRAERQLTRTFMQFVQPRDIEQSILRYYLPSE